MRTPAHKPSIRLLLSPDAEHFVSTPAWPTDFLTENHALIQRYQFDADGYETIGDLRYTVARLNWAYNCDVSWHDVFNEHGSEYAYLYELLFDENEDISRAAEKSWGQPFSIISYDALIIDSLRLDPEFRGEKLGLHALQLLMRSSACGIAVLHASPLVSEGERPDAERVKDEAALRKYYRKLGFKRIDRTDYMVVDLGARLPRL